MSTRAGMITALALLLTLLVVQVYRTQGSEQAAVRKVGEAFFTAAIQGDAAHVETNLAADASLTASEVIAMYSTFVSPGDVQVAKAPANRSGVQYVVWAFGTNQDGYTASTLLLLRHDEGRWVVVQAGSDLAY